VLCRAARRGDGRAVELLEVLDCWLGVDHRYFKMLGADGATYILRHDTARERWELTMYAAARRWEDSENAVA
jgi:hypothetical protein